MAGDSLFDASSPSVLLSAGDWLSALMTGSAATILATIAVAWIGFQLLQGEVNVRRGLTVVMGLFLLFGAPAISQALQMLSASQPLPEQASQQYVPPPVYPRPPSAPTTSPVSNDPYAGAALPQM